MTRAIIVVTGSGDRERAAKWAKAAPYGTRISFRTGRRSLPQNDRLWAMLTAVSLQVDWYGRKLKPDEWKDVFTASLRRQVVVPSIEGDSFVALGHSTSAMSKQELSDLMDLIAAFGAEHGVKFGDDNADA